MTEKNQVKDDEKKEDCSCYAGSRNVKTCPPIRNITHPLRYYEFTQDEIRALEQCDKESFYRRCLPLSTAFATATYFAIKTGRLKPNPRFGPYPKVTLAVIVGYFLGKVSYQRACAEKLMALPGSYIGQLLRDRRDGKATVQPIPKQPATMFGAGPSDIYSDAGPGSSLDLDTDRPLFSDDTYRPDNAGAENQTPPVARPSLSYDELRRRNRGEYVDAKQDPYKIDPALAPPISRPRPPPSSQHTNKYGDVMD